MRTSRKKILCFSHMCAPKFITGAERNLLFFIHEVRLWIDAVLVVPNEGMLSAEARRKNIPVIVGDFPAVPRFLWPKASFLEELALIESSPYLKNVEELLLSEKPDVVITNTTINPLPAIVSKKLGIPVAWWIREIIPSRPYYEDVIQFIEQHADWIPGSSNAVLQRFSNNKRILIHPSWRNEDYSPKTWDENRYVLREKLNLDKESILVGTISAYILAEKGLEHFIKMALSLCKQYAHVHFASIGSRISADFYDQCLRLITGSGHENKFHFLDFAKEIEQIYPALDIVIIPSLIDEGFGTTALEGLAFGKPVVAYASGGLKEILNATSNDELLVEKGNISQLASQVSKLIADKNLRTNVGGSNRAVANQVFGIEVYHRTVKIFLQIMDCMPG